MDFKISGNLNKIWFSNDDDDYDDVSSLYVVDCYC